MRRCLVLVIALACKDGTKTETPRPGSAMIDGATPPVPSKPLDAAKLARHDVAGWTRDVRLADARGLEVRYRSGAIVVTVQIAKCFDCLPMQLDRWQAKSDALRGLIAAELRDHASTTWELGMTDLAGTPIAWTFHTGDTGAVYGSAYTLYFNDGAHMIRVAAEPVGDGTRLSRPQLEAAARAFLDRFVHLWG